MKNQKGSVLLITLLLMAALLASSIALSTLIIGNLRISSDFSHAIRAYYAAESGIERGLWKTRETRSSGGSFDSLRSSVAEGKVVVSSSLNTSYIITSSDVRDVQSEIVFPELGSNQSVQVDLFPIGRGSESLKISKLIVSWDDDCDHCTQTEYTLLSWQQGTHDITNAKIEKFFQTWATQGSVGLDPAKIYSVRIKNFATAGNGTMIHLTLRAQDSDDQPVSLSSNVTIHSIGSSGRSSQAIEATVPWRLSSGSMYDYVLFSEKDLDK